MRNNTPFTSKAQALIPGSSDPEITRAQIREAKAWVESHSILVGDWVRVFKVPRYDAFSNMIGEGVDIYRRFMGGSLVHPKFLEKMNYDDAFCRPRTEAVLVSLRTKPFGGNDEPLTHIRTTFASAGRRIASSPEVVAGFVAYHVATVIPALEHKARVQELEARGKASWLVESPRGFLSQGFAPSNVFRSTNTTFSYNSQVGLQRHDFPSDKGAPNLYVVERL